MSNPRFDSFKEGVGQFGLYMDSRLAQREVNGLLGMYASSDIPQGTVLAKWPSEKLLSPIPPEERNIQGVERLIVNLAGLMAAEEPAKDILFEYCGSVEERKKHNVCYFSDDDIQFLSRMNPNLSRMASEARSQFEKLVSGALTREPDLNEEHVKLATHIFNERCWGNFGFMPGVDLFNHNTKSNLMAREIMLDGEKVVALVAPSNIEKDEEIFITYGKKDMFDFALLYDFFDPADFHLISFTRRVTLAIPDDFARQLVNHLSNSYNVRILPGNGHDRFGIVGLDDYFLEQGPNTKIVDLASRLAIRNDRDLKSGKAGELDTIQYLLHVLETFKSINKVHDVPFESVPDKLKHYHRLLEKEYEILESNINIIRKKLASLTHMMQATR